MKVPGADATPRPTTLLLSSSSSLFISGVIHYSRFSNRTV